MTPPDDRPPEDEYDAHDDGAHTWRERLEDWLDEQKYLNKFSLIFVFLLLGVAAFFTHGILTQKEKIALDERLCPINPEHIQAYALVLLDGTDPIVGEYAASLQQNVRDIADALPQYGKLSLHDIATGKKRLLALCSPAKPAQCDSLTEGCERLERRYQNIYLRPVADAVDAFLNDDTRDQTQSPILQRLSEVAALSDFQSAPARSFHLFSDMLQHDESGYSHYRRKVGDDEFSWLARQPFYQNNKPPLQGVATHVYYLLRDKNKQQQSAAHQKFWNDLLNDAGADGVVWKKINLPNESPAAAESISDSRPAAAPAAGQKSAAAPPPPTEKTEAPPAAPELAPLSDTLPRQLLGKNERARYLLAQRDKENGELAAAVEKYEYLAKRGHFASMRDLGQIYILQNEHGKASYWLRYAAENGDIGAQSLLAHHLLYNRNAFEEGVQWLAAAAAAGEKTAKETVAMIDALAEDANAPAVAGNAEQQAQEYRRAFVESDGKDYAALRGLLTLYENGALRQREDDTVRDLIARAALKNDAPPDVRGGVGRLYLRGGGGFRKNLHDAYMLLTCAGEKDDNLLANLRRQLRDNGKLKVAESNLNFMKEKKRCVS